MSKIGYINKSFGTEIKVASANTYGYNVLSGSNLPANTLILASPTDENNEDTGSYSLLMTDYLSNPVRLTYTLREGSGIVFNDDSLHVKIDNSTIIEKNKELTANISALVDEETIIYDGEKIKLNIEKFSKATALTTGVYKVDEKTIKNSDDELFVDTSRLNYANEDTGTSGIFIGDGKLIKTTNGVISLDQYMLHKADSESFGTMIGNSSTINVEEGMLSVNTTNLALSNIEPGIVTADNNTIEFNTDSELRINTENLTKTSASTLGVFKYDPNSFELNNETLKIKNYSKFSNLISTFIDKTQLVDDKIKDIKYLLDQYQIGMQKPEILDFHCANILTGVLEKPWYKDQSVADMPHQFISTDFIISTNCPFIISIKYEDNVDPAISLYQINYNTIDVYNGNSGLFEVFQTTQERKIPLRMTFICKNYYKEDKTDFSKKVKIKVTVSYYNDVSINKSILYSIVRFNSGYTQEIEYEDINIESFINKNKGTSE